MFVGQFTRTNVWCAGIVVKIVDSIIELVDIFKTNRVISWIIVTTSNAVLFYHSVSICRHINSSLTFAAYTLNRIRATVQLSTDQNSWFFHHLDSYVVAWWSRWSKICFDRSSLQVWQFLLQNKEKCCTNTIVFRILTQRY